MSIERYKKFLSFGWTTRNKRIVKIFVHSTFWSFCSYHWPEKSRREVTGQSGSVSLLFDVLDRDNNSLLTDVTWRIFLEGWYIVVSFFLRTLNLKTKYLLKVMKVTVGTLLTCLCYMCPGWLGSRVLGRSSPLNLMTMSSSTSFWYQRIPRVKKFLFGYLGIYDYDIVCIFRRFVV